MENSVREEKASGKKSLAGKIFDGAKKFFIHPRAPDIYPFFTGAWDGAIALNGHYEKPKYIATAAILILGAHAVQYTHGLINEMRSKSPQNNRNS